MRTVNSTRVTGSMKNSDGTIALKNIETFLRDNNFPQSAICMEQIHSGNVSIVNETDQPIVSSVDALVSDKKNISLCVVTADCLPIMLYDPEKKVIGVAHAGSKGLLQNIIKNTLDTLKSQYHSRPEDIVVKIGPSIEKACYEVGEDLIVKFENTFPWIDKKEYISPKNDKYLLDLRFISLQCLLKEGILKKHIEVSDTCTKCNRDELFSYRGGDKTGRFVSVISL